MFDDSKIKETISRLREERSISQTEMADRIGVSRNAYRGLEKGKTAILNPKLKEISKCLGMEVDDILSLAYPKGVLQDSQESFYITSISHLEERIKMYERLVKTKEERIDDLQKIIDDLEEKISQQRQTIEMQSKQNMSMSERLAQYEGNE